MIHSLSPSPAPSAPGRRAGFRTPRVRELDRRWDPVQGRDVYVLPSRAHAAEERARA